MSRSRRKTPRAALCCDNYGAAKKWKKECSRKIRNKKDVANYGYYRKLTDPWSHPADGKIWIDPESKWMRK